MKDRRAEPTAGYRAVHVVVAVQDLPVEIQVRTQRQDQWAQIVEALGDKWGRGIRYGLGADQPEKPLKPGSPATRGELWNVLSNLSGTVDQTEKFGHLVDVLERLGESAPTHRATDAITDALFRAADALGHLDVPLPHNAADIDAMIRSLDVLRRAFKATSWFARPSPLSPSSRQP